MKQLLAWLELGSSKYHTWKKRYGKANEHNGKIPRDYWLQSWEKQAIIGYHQRNPLEGSRRLTFMMLDADIVAVSPSTTYRVLKSAGLLDRKNVKASKKGTGFKQPKKPHQHWHIDISYLNLGGTFYFLISVLDGYSRSIVHYDICEKMEEKDVVHYNEVRLHSAIGYVTPQAMLEGRAEEITTARDRKLETAREARRVKRAEANRAVETLAS